MKKTWKPIVAGVLMIVAVCYMILLLVPMLLIGGGMYGIEWKRQIFSSMVMVIIGILGLVSSIFALRRKRWFLTIAGSACIILVTLVFTVLDALILSSGTHSITRVIELIPMFLTIPAVVLLVLSKKEFVHPAKSDIPTSN
jgi:hypothetical protein